MSQQDAKTIDGLKTEVARLRELLRMTEDSLRASQDEVMRLSTIDALTAVFNRRHFMDVADQEISRARRYKRPLAVLALGVDNIRAINESHGSDRGDGVLAAVGAAALRTLRTTDYVGRLSGSQFAVMLPETEHDGCMILAERMCIDLARAGAEELGDVSPLPVISVGATHFVREDVIFDACFQRADSAMTTAREQGGAKVLYVTAEEVDAA